MQQSDERELYVIVVFWDHNVVILLVVVGYLLAGETHLFVVVEVVRIHQLVAWWGMLA